MISKLIAARARLYDIDPVLRCFVPWSGETTPIEVPRKDIYLCDMPDTVENTLPTPRVLALDLICVPSHARPTPAGPLATAARSGA